VAHCRALILTCTSLPPRPVNCKLTCMTLHGSGDDVTVPSLRLYPHGVDALLTLIRAPFVHPTIIRVLRSFFFGISVLRSRHFANTLRLIQVFCFLLLLSHFLQWDINYLSLVQLSVLHRYLWLCHEKNSKAVCLMVCAADKPADTVLLWEKKHNIMTDKSRW
jgi:hypothetical protein